MTMEEMRKLEEVKALVIKMVDLSVHFQMPERLESSDDARRVLAIWSAVLDHVNAKVNMWGDHLTALEDAEKGIK